MAKKKVLSETSVSPSANKPGTFEMTRAYEVIPNYYCNSSTARYSKNDVHIIFSHLLAKTEEKMQVCPQAIVYMTPTHAKQLLRVLQTVVDDHEKKYGELESPAHIMINREGE